MFTEYIVFAGKVICWACKKSCKGQAIRLQDKFFHVKCFKCKGKICTSTRALIKCRETGKNPATKPYTTSTQKKNQYTFYPSLLPHLDSSRWKSPRPDHGSVQRPTHSKNTAHTASSRILLSVAAHLCPHTVTVSDVQQYCLQYIHIK